ncbi:hypothetical protein COLO4_03097 [Corchorus olitorius]|uniref:Uncharacterized protein n=1 Tax=Corchorus olitorius TaxID=93759 RepID=A0A1R3KZN8_9ROSI|nr:hypothetical protein COLO4_03280 [Corchorus olitorius]OMP12509.1 hypothetical protein COLO4_03097 [Corchorus olitorius]
MALVRAIPSCPPLFFALASKVGIPCALLWAINGGLLFTDEENGF